MLKLHTNKEFQRNESEIRRKIFKFISRQDDRQVLGQF